MENSKSKLWIMGYLIIVIGALAVVGCLVIHVDPFFHYHAPYTDVYFYTLNNQRSQNDGITKHFEYDALITGTSMTENFKTSEMDSIFGTNSIKICYSGGRYKEINDNLRIALSYNLDLNIIIRGLDYGIFITDKDARREDLGEFPDYLYDDLWYNDVYYIFNRDVIFGRVYYMVLDRVYSTFTENDDSGYSPGITSFDDYSNWMSNGTFGINAVCPEGVQAPAVAEPVHLSDADREMVLENIRQNVTSLAEEYPDVTFYYFFTPYSIVWWRGLVNSGGIYRQVEAERLVIEEILQYDNIKLYSFNNLTDITTDLNNYKDIMHYGEWINSLMLRYMKDETCLLTYDNYEAYLEEELSFYTGYDYEQLNDQEDYECDYYAAALLNYEITGTEPLNILDSCSDNMELKNADIVAEQYDSNDGLVCSGCLHREENSVIAVADYIASSSDYVGARFTIEDISGYKYLVFYGMKNQDDGQPGVYIYNVDNEVVAEFTQDSQEIDDQWHQYLIDVSELTGAVTVVLNGGYIDSSGSGDSMYTFSDIVLY